MQPTPRPRSASAQAVPAVTPRPRGKKANGSTVPTPEERADAQVRYDELADRIPLGHRAVFEAVEDLKAGLGLIPASDRVKVLANLVELQRGAEDELSETTAWLERLKFETAQMLESGIGQKLGAVSLASVSTDAPAALLIERLDPTGHTILYGTGGVGKGLLTTEWLKKMLESGQRVLIADYENHPDEWARRLHGLGGGDLMPQVLHVAPLTSHWHGKRGAIWVQAQDLRALSQAFEATYLLIDSIVPACAGTDPLKPEAAAQYAGALEYIGLPALSLAHVRKDESLSYPFGSAFWHNLARMTWSIKRQGSDTLLANPKHNNYPKSSSQLVSSEWSDGRPVEVWERPYAAVLANRIEAALASGSLTVKEIAEALNDELDEDDEEVKEDSLRSALRRGQKARPPLFEKDGKVKGADRWKRTP